MARKYKNPRPLPMWSEALDGPLSVKAEPHPVNAELARLGVFSGPFDAKAEKAQYDAFQKARGWAKVELG